MDMMIGAVSGNAVPEIPLRDRRSESIDDFMAAAKDAGLAPLYCRLAVGAHLNCALPMRGEDLLPYVESALKVASWPRACIAKRYEGPAKEKLELAYAFIVGKHYVQK